LSILGVLSIVCASVSGSGSSASSSATSINNIAVRVLSDNKVACSIGYQDVEDAEVRIVKRIDGRVGAESSYESRNIDLGVNERNNAAKLDSDGKSRVGADVLGIAVLVGVGVLLRSDHANGSSNSISASTEISDDLVGSDELV
jgi:hypothetical protein